MTRGACTTSASSRPALAGGCRSPTSSGRGAPSFRKSAIDKQRTDVFGVLSFFMTRPSRLHPRARPGARDESEGFLKLAGVRTAVAAGATIPAVEMLFGGHPGTIALRAVGGLPSEPLPSYAITVGIIGNARHRGQASIMSCVAGSPASGVSGRSGSRGQLLRRDRSSQCRRRRYRSVCVQ